MSPVQFGIFDWIDHKSVPMQQLYEERLRLVEIADEAGFYCYHMAEHHATPLGMAPSPGIFLAALSQRTRNIRFGPLCYLLPLYEPLRLIEEICMLDNLSGGRLDLGISRGVSPYELGYFNVDYEGTRPVFDEALEILLKGLTEERLNFAGKHYHYDDVPMEVTPMQKPYPPLWYPTHNPESMNYVAENGFNYVGLGPARMVRENVDKYWSIRNNATPESRRLNPHVSEPKVGVNRQVVIAETDAEAFELTQRAHADWFHSITKLMHDNNNDRDDALFNWDSAVNHKTILFGSPETVREEIKNLVDTSGCNYVISAFAWGSMTFEESARSMRLFANEVMPAFAA